MTAVRNIDHKKNEFQNQLDALIERINKLELDAAIQHTLDEKTKKIHGNILLFTQDRLYLYKPIEKGIEELHHIVSKLEHDAKNSLERKSVEKKPEKIDVLNEDLNFDVLTAESEKPKQNNFSFFHHNNASKTENKNPEAHQHHESRVGSMFRRGASSFLSLFTACFNPRKSIEDEPAQTNVSQRKFH